jgi:hypothetical protein
MIEPRLNLETPRMRARRIVKLASTKTQLEYLQTWFLRDERGAWEEDALDLLNASAARVTELRLTDGQTDEQVALILVYLGLTAIEKNLKKGSVL